MRRSLSVAVAVVVATIATTAALAKVPKGAVRGTFTIGILASTDPLAKYMKAGNVWCAWSKDRVIVHVNLKNTSAEHVTATIKPRYFIARGGEHGSSFLGAKNFGFDAGEFRSLWIDAGAPEGVKPKTRIARCAPYLFLIESG